ncbi:hypothetical protein J6590_045895 [Homalodisca vitripennis]|nr:hypothetical protein J6590_045895 [Homalodisca vitripennis]
MKSYRGVPSHATAIIIQIDARSNLLGCVNCTHFRSPLRFGRHPFGDSFPLSTDLIPANNAHLPTVAAVRLRVQQESLSLALHLAYLRSIGFVSDWNDALVIVATMNAVNGRNRWLVTGTDGKRDRRPFSAYVLSHYSDLITQYSADREREQGNDHKIGLPLCTGSQTTGILLLII